MDKFMRAVAGCIQHAHHHVHTAVTNSLPTAQLQDFLIVSANFDKAEIAIDIIVTNRLPFSFPPWVLDYRIEINGSKLLSDSIPGRILHPGATTIRIPVTVTYREVMRCLRPGRMNRLRVVADIFFNRPVSGRFSSLPVTKTCEAEVPCLPLVDLDTIRIDNASNDEISATVRLKLENKSEFEVELGDLDVKAELCGAKVGSLKAKRMKMGKNAVCFVEFCVELRPKDLMVTMLGVIGGEKDNVGLSVNGSVEIGTTFGKWKVPISIVR